MVLSFKEQFKDSIINGNKIHTIREDKHNRWRKWMFIHFATGVRTKNYSQFHADICRNTQKIKIEHLNNWLTIYVDGRLLNEKEIKLVALNDGFKTMEDFRKWFDKDFEGKIIHWTNYKY